jgi:hypothetical protein
MEQEGETTEEYLCKCIDSYNITMRAVDTMTKAVRYSLDSLGISHRESALTSGLRSRIEKAGLLDIKDAAKELGERIYHYLGGCSRSNIADLLEENIVEFVLSSFGPLKSRKLILPDLPAAVYVAELHGIMTGEDLEASLLSTENFKKFRWADQDIEDAHPRELRDFYRRLNDFRRSLDSLLSTRKRAMAGWRDSSSQNDLENLQRMVDIDERFGMELKNKDFEHLQKEGFIVYAPVPYVKVNRREYIPKEDEVYFSVASGMGAMNSEESQCGVRFHGEILYLALLPETPDFSVEPLIKELKRVADFKKMAVRLEEVREWRGK